MQDMEIPLTYNNKVELLMTGREKFIDLFETIRHARHHIHLEYFNFRNDSIANALFDLLAEKVKEGVEVRAMFDAFGNWSNNQPLKNIIAGDKGTRHRTRQVRPHHLSLYQPCHAPRPPEDSGYRRKIGYTGGMNIADYYINGLPKIGKWHDIHMHIEGDAVRYLQGIFLTMWNRETGQHIGGPAYFPNLPQFPDSIAEEIAIVDRTRGKHPGLSAMPMPFR